jgi:hypothetical protein
MLRFFEKIMTSRAECWVMVALFVINLGAAIPFGVSSPDPKAALTPVEWVSSAMLFLLAVAIFVGMHHRRVLSWAGLAGGMIWIAVAVGTLYDNLSTNQSIATEIALFFLPVGISIAHFSLEHAAERPHNTRSTDRLN